MHTKNHFGNEQMSAFIHLFISAFIHLFPNFYNTAKLMLVKRGKCNQCNVLMIIPYF